VILDENCIAVEDRRRALPWLIPTLDRMPQQRCFTLGERMEGALLEVLEALLQAAYRRDKRAALTPAHRVLKVARHL
jgi:hypothetical protein